MMFLNYFISGQLCYTDLIDLLTQIIDLMFYINILLLIYSTSHFMDPKGILQYQKKPHQTILMDVIKVKFELKLSTRLYTASVSQY